jgi:hypothetical protein
VVGAIVSATVLARSGRQPAVAARAEAESAGA